MACVDAPHPVWFLHPNALPPISMLLVTSGEKRDRRLSFLWVRLSSVSTHITDFIHRIFFSPHHIRALLFPFLSVSL